MMSVSLKEFIETGYFGAVCLGMNRTQVENILGIPEDTGGTSNKYRNPSIWKYGDVEFHFEDGADNLWLIHLDDFDVPSCGVLVDLDPWVISGSLTLAQAESQLLQSGLALESRTGGLEDGFTCLIVGAGVKLLFSNAERLQALSYSVETAR
ncbi:MAG: hypothetical protein ND895_01935 [Pyrinomonadaceae bacterium]|nr:hypothetical protein [Pyrinomonadaceae bacterium]